MSSEDIKWLSQFEKNFRTAINSNYSRNILNSQLKKMVDIYEGITGKKYNLCYHCASAVLGFLQDMGKIYFEKVQDGFETEVNINELDESVTELERITTKKDTTNNTKKNTKKNGKHTKA